MIFWADDVPYYKFEDEYSKLPKNKWVVVVHGTLGKSVEISCVHTSDKHAFKSCGWWSSHKVVVYSSGHDDAKYIKSFRKHLQMMHIQQAVKLAEELLRCHPDGVPMRD